MNKSVGYFLSVQSGSKGSLLYSFDGLIYKKEKKAKTKKEEIEKKNPALGKQIHIYRGCAFDFVDHVEFVAVNTFKVL